jgi:acyl-CoA reductase-like NAD-dependent aldehyde dehydrogenase
MNIVNPATGETIREMTETSPPQIEEALKRSRLAQPEWAGRSIAERIGIIKRYHDLLERDAEQLARDLTLEVGKPLQESRN